MSIKKKIAIGLVLCLIISGAIASGIRDSRMVWAKHKLDTDMDMAECFTANVCNGKIYYIDSKNSDCVMEVNPVNGRSRTINLDWNMENAYGTVLRKYFLAVTVGEDGSIYGVAVIKHSEYYFSHYLCKFTKDGKQVYATSLTSHLWDAQSSGWSSQYHLEVDGKGRVYFAKRYKLLLFDEDGNYEKYVDVNPLEELNDPEIWDMTPGRDGSMYLIFDEHGKSYLSRVDYESGTLVTEQHLIYGEHVCYDVEDGIYMDAGDALYYYETDKAVVGRVPEKLFDWWDLLIYEGNVKVVAAPKKNCVLVVSFSSLEESCGVFLIEKMTKGQAERKGYTYVEIP